MRGKEKMLVTSIFCYYHNVFNPPKTNFHFLATFNLLSANAFLKICRLVTSSGKMEKMLVTSIFSFPTMFSNLSETNSIIWVSFKLLSENALNLDKSKISSFGKRLIFATQSLVLTTLTKASYENIGKGRKYMLPLCFQTCHRLIQPFEPHLNWCLKILLRFNIFIIYLAVKSWDFPM